MSARPSDVTVAIELMEASYASLLKKEAEITLPEFRRLKTLRHRLADFLVRSVKADVAEAKEPREDG